MRYDFSTATNILECMKLLEKKYGGSLEKLHELAFDSSDLEKRLMEFKGVGPTCTNIFLRELRGIWPKANPKISSIAKAIANYLGTKNVEKYESPLVRIYLEYCKKHKCKECLVNEFCNNKIKTT